ncbi:MAG TPA: DUF2723 domain-containing protein [Anaerolineae bacterium]|nr:DUF2723 domain-containing protein [Anaerolineae bacterium]
MNRARWQHVGAFVLTLVLGLILGAAIARSLAESLLYRYAFFLGWLPTVAMALLGAGFLALLYLWLTRQQTRRTTSMAVAISFLPFSLLLIYLVQREINTVQAFVLLAGTVALVAALHVALSARRQHLDRMALIAVFVLAFALYVRTLAPVVGAHDTFEFQVLSYELGIAHPTGYPLYIILGKLFTLLPLGNVAYRVNLSSALFAATAVVMLHAIIAELTRSRSAAALGALSFAFSYSFWSQAVEAEVYALNALLVSAICYLLLRTFARDTNNTPSCRTSLGEEHKVHWSRALGAIPRGQRMIVAVALIYGLSLTHHRTMLLLGPAIIAYLTLRRAWCLLTRRSWIATFTAFLAPLVGVHLYIPIRWWQIQGSGMHWEQFTNLILGTQFAAALRWDTALRDPERMAIFLRALLDQYPAPALLLATLGIIYLPWRRDSTHGYPTWREGLFLLLAFGAYVAFGLSYNVPDISLFLIPSYMIIAIALGVGVFALRRSLEELLGRKHLAVPQLRRQLIASAILTVVGILPLGLAWTNLPKVDRSDARAGYDWGRYVLQQDLPAHSVLLADSEKMAPLHYLQRVERLRPDTETGVFPDEETNRAELEARLREGRPVLLARFLPELEGTYHLRSLGPLVEVSTGPLARLPADVNQLNLEFGDKVVLAGYRLGAQNLERSDALRLTLFWKAQRGVRDNYDVRLRLVGATGHVWIETKGRPPVSGLYPTAAWRPGEIVPDYHAIDLAGQLPPGSYHLDVGLFAPFSQEGLASSDSHGGYVTLADVSVTSGEAWRPTIHHPLRANFEDQILLLGYSFPSTITPGPGVPLTLYWRAVDQIETDYEVVLQFSRPDGTVVWQAVEQPLFGEHPTSEWTPADVLADTHLVEIARTASGPLDLRIGLRDPSSEAYLTVIDGWLASQRYDVLLTGHTVAESPVILTEADNLPANFENEILLLDYEIHNVQVRKGGALNLTLTWQALVPMDEDYTVFVHLLDDNDQIWGQEDIAPVRGTHPTSGWTEAEVVVDPHTVWTHQQAPLGLYRVEVGLYLLRTMERLQLLDASGSAIDDRLIIDLMEVVP